MVKRDIRRKAAKLFRSGMSTAGRLLPLKAKISLAKRSTKLGYLLDRDGDFLFPDYLGSFRVNINVKYSPERVLLTGDYEEDLWWVVRNHVSPGDVCVDVGANVGAITLLLAKAVGTTGRVYSFEPGPVFCERLRKNVALNPSIQNNVTAFNVGVADKKGVLHWAEDPEFPGNAHMFGKKGMEVEVVTLDTFLLPQLTRMDFLKIDVEGMELEVLTGAKELIRKFRPKIIYETMMDFELYRKAPIRKLTEDFLRENGYELFRVTEKEGAVPVTYPHFSLNTLALPR